MVDIADLRDRWEKLCEEMAKVDEQRLAAMRTVLPMFAAVAAGGRENPSEAVMKAWDDAEARQPRHPRADGCRDRGVATSLTS